MNRVQVHHLDDSETWRETTLLPGDTFYLSLNGRERLRMKWVQKRPWWKRWWQR